MARDYLNQVIIEIVGCDKRLTGYSEKTKSNYDFQKVSFTFSHPHMEGVRADTTKIQGAALDKLGYNGEPVKVGDLFDAWVQVDQYENAKIAALVARA